MPRQQEKPIEWISQQRAAELAGVNVATIRRYIRQFEATGGRAGLGPVSRPSAQIVRIPIESFNRWMLRGVDLKYRAAVV